MIFTQQTIKGITNMPEIIEVLKAILSELQKNK